MSIGSISVKLSLEYTSNEWRVITPSGQYWVLASDFSNIRQAIQGLLEPEALIFIDSLGMRSKDDVKG